MKLAEGPGRSSARSFKGGWGVGAEGTPPQPLAPGGAEVSKGALTTAPPRHNSRRVPSSKCRAVVMGPLQMGRLKGRYERSPPSVSNPL